MYLFHWSTAGACVIEGYMQLLRPGDFTMFNAQPRPIGFTMFYFLFPLKHAMLSECAALAWASAKGARTEQNQTEQNTHLQTGVQRAKKFAEVLCKFGFLSQPDSRIRGCDCFLDPCLGESLSLGGNASSEEKQHILRLNMRVLGHMICILINS
jgi:hypothetical protein